MDPTTPPWRVLEDAPAGAVGPAGAVRREPIINRSTLVIVAAAIALAVGAFALAFGSSSSGAFAFAAGASLVPVDAADDRPGASAPGPRAGGTVVGPEGVLVVEIVGAVERPGVFRLPVDARVGDLIKAAGGYGSRVDTDRAARELNLAAPLRDGDQVRVPSRDDADSGTVSSTTGSGGASSTGGGSQVGPLSLNRATTTELEALPGIGPVTAGKIIASREEAPFADVDDLRTRKLVGEKTFDKLRDLVAAP